MTERILLFGIVAALAQVLGGSLIYFKKSWPKRVQETLLALGAGFILALVFLKLIPASIATLGESAALYLMLGYATIHFFEHTVVGHFHFGEEVHSEVMVSKAASISAFSGLFIHAFFDGFSISVGMQFNFSVGLLVFIAVLLHKFPEGLTIGSIMLAAGYPRKTIMLSSLGIGLATVLGVCTVFLFRSASAEITGAAFAFSAGAAVYVGASDLIPEINKSENRVPPLIVFGGMMLFYFSEKFLEGLLK
ncbi:MAG: ZIP family metal transporter [Ignavibacteriales bacterium]|nr:ZIP family metal transporter [Ignavibacteriales bacterium]MBI3787840.1 ZIP family metal transporter [Ignavibacteriales bacterium]